MKKSALLVVLLLAGIAIMACGLASTPAPTATPVVGCPVVIDQEGLPYFDNSHDGTPLIVTQDEPYVDQRYPFSYVRVECVDNQFPRVILALADSYCETSTIEFEIDGGWSCDLEGGIGFMMEVGGNYLYPLGVPENYISPTPIIPGIPSPPTQESNQQQG